MERTKSHEKARSSLSEELVEHFDNFIEDYKHETILKYGKPYVNYEIMAMMIKIGWRRSAPEA